MIPDLHRAGHRVSARRFAAELAEAATPDVSTPDGYPSAHVVYGVVQSVQAGGTLTALVGGLATPVPGLAYLSSYSPIVGDVVAMLVSGGDHLVLASQAGAPALGLLAHQRITASSSTFTTTRTQLMTLTTTIGAARVIRLDAKVRVSSTVVGDVMTVYFLRDGVIIDSNDYVQPSGAAPPQQPWTTDEGAAAGSHTYSVAAIRSSGSGTLFNQAAALKPSLFTIEDKGAV